MSAHNAEKDAIKAEALREAADLLVAECSSIAAPCFCSSAPWLRERADVLDPREMPPATTEGDE